MRRAWRRPHSPEGTTTTSDGEHGHALAAERVYLRTLDEFAAQQVAAMAEDIVSEAWMQELTLALHRAVAERSSELSRDATIREPAERVGVGEDEVIEAFDASSAYSVSSLDRVVGVEADGTTVGDLIGRDDPAYDRMIDHEVLKILVRGWDERDKRILLLRYFRGLTQLEIGNRLGVSRMHV